MKPIVMKIALPFVVIAVGFGGMQAIKATGEQESEQEAVDTRQVAAFRLFQFVADGAAAFRHDADIRIGLQSGANRVFQRQGLRRKRIGGGKDGKNRQ